MRRRHTRTTILKAVTLVAALQFVPFAIGADREAWAETERIAAEVSLTGTGVIVDDDEDQFRQRHRVPNNGFGGVENLYMEWLHGEDVSIKLEGRGIIDANDYLAKIRIEKPEKGYVSAGYREFRTWYDGTGGFFPQNAAIFSIFDENLELDRGEAWFEAGVRAPDAPPWPTDEYRIAAMKNSAPRSASCAVTATQRSR